MYPSHCKDLLQGLNVFVNIIKLNVLSIMYLFFLYMNVTLLFLEVDGYAKFHVLS